MDQLASIDKFALGTGFILLYLLGVALYRLYLSPIAKFPGPKLAALTSWYEAYYDIIRKGKYVFEIEDMHRKYGPIVRINPHELVIKDPEYYQELYVSASTRKTETYPQFLGGLNMGDSHSMTVQHDLHRQRRKPLEPFFSKKGIVQLESTLSGLSRKFCERVDCFKGTSKVVQLGHAFGALTEDAITGICCDKPSHNLEEGKFYSIWLEVLKDFTTNIHIATNFPQLTMPILIAPTALIDWLAPGYKPLRESDAAMQQHAIRAKAQKADGTDGGGRPNLLRHLAHSDMPLSELHEKRLAKEAFTVLSAGVHTTARTLEFISYHIIKNQLFKLDLQKELEPIMADYPQTLPSVSQLEALPYLSALIKESHRLGHIIMHRLPRVSPNVPLVYKDWIIPRGVPVSMHTHFMHTDPDVYPEPDKFRPDRWIGDIDPRMNKYLVPFTKGSRDCLGKNLASAELLMVIACLFRPNGPEFELFETDDSDIAPKHDFIAGLPKLDSKGLRVLVH